MFTFAAGGGDAGGAGGDGAAVGHSAPGTDEHGGGGDGRHLFSFFVGFAFCRLPLEAPTRESRPPSHKHTPRRLSDTTVTVLK